MPTKLLIPVAPGQMTEDPATNLGLLEAAARNSTAFGKDLDFDATCWPLERRSLTQSGKVTLWFTVAAGKDEASKSAKNRAPLREPFATFLKSIIRLSQAARPRAHPTYLAMLRAGRYLHDALAAKAYNPAKLTDNDFLIAQKIPEERGEAQWSCYQVAKDLRTIARIVNDYRLSEARIKYVANVDMPRQAGAYVDAPPGEDHLPSPTALSALPTIAQQLTDPADICAMRAVELLHCAPWRVSELLNLPERCEVVTTIDGEPLSASDIDRPDAILRLRYRPVKSAKLRETEKAIPSATKSLVKRALADLRRYTAHAREVARYMEEHPGRAWLPEQFRTRERLHINDVATILGSDTNEAWRWLRYYKVDIRPDHVLRDDLEQGLLRTPSSKNSERLRNEDVRQYLADHPAAQIISVETVRSIINVWEPYAWLRRRGIRIIAASVSRIDLERQFLTMNPKLDDKGAWRLSERLFIFPLHFFHPRRRSLLPVVQPYRVDQLRIFLTGDKNIPSVFERFGITEPDGTPIRLTSHMFRHWLATLALNKEMSGQEVAKWLGHTNERNVGAYDRRTPEMLGRWARAAVEKGHAIGPLAQVAKSIKEPRDRESFLEAMLATAHITDYGMCSRDWQIAPCPRHGVCASCEKQLVLKGDSTHRRNCERTLRENRVLLERALEQEQDGQRGASNYVRHLRREIAALEATLAIHDNPEIADGTLVELEPAVFKAELVD